MKRFALFAPALALTVVSSAMAQRPAAKPPTKKTGVTSAGPFGRIDALPKLGIQLTLLSAEFTLEPVNIGDNRMSPKADQKLLVVRFKAQNAKSGDLPMPLRGSMVQAVAQDDATYVACEELGYEAKSIYKDAETRKPANALILKRVQNAPTCVAVIPVPAEGQVPKLIFHTGEGGNILRYDLRGKVKPLPTADRAPEDVQGFTPRKEYTWKKGEVARTWGMDFTVENVEVIDKEDVYTFIQAGRKDDGLISATIKIAVQTPYEKYLFNSDNKLEVRAFDTDGNSYEATLMAGSRDEGVGVTHHGKGSQVRIRAVIAFPREAKLDKLVFRNHYWTGPTENPTAGTVEPSRPYIFPGDMLFPGGLKFPPYTDSDGGQP